MKAYKYFIPLILILFTACNEDFLGLHSPTDVSTANFWKNESDVRLGLNGIYSVLQSRPLYAGSFFYSASLTDYDGFADNTWNRIQFMGPGFWVKGQLNSANPLFERFWNANYRGIARANDAIANISEMTDKQLPKEKRDEYIGQVYFLRALFYYHLAVYFEDVPLILEPQTLETPFPEKNSQRKILDQIISDLNKAGSVLPVSQPSDLLGYATKGAALGLLTRVHLFDKNWQAAASSAKKVIELGVYDLNLPYRQQFTPAGETSGDVVFSVKFSDAPSFNVGEQISNTTFRSPRWTYQPLANCVNAFKMTDGKSIDESPLYDPDNPKENRDPRAIASIYFPGDQYHYNPDKLFTGNSTGFAQKKYLRNRTSDAGTPVNEPGGQDFYVIRYADVLLMRAEALIELNTDLEEVYSLINQVRDRVNMPHIEDVEGPGLSQSELQDVLRDERRVELAFEGLRFFDVKRWDIVEEAYNRITQDAEEAAETVPGTEIGILRGNVSYQGRKSEVFPIPQSELDTNPKLTQHEAW